MIETSIGEARMQVGPASWARRAVGGRLGTVLLPAGFLLLGLTLLFVMHAGAARAGGADPVPVVRATMGETAPVTYTLTLLHTNDTWDYLDPCG